MDESLDPLRVFVIGSADAAGRAMRAIFAMPRANARPAKLESCPAVTGALDRIGTGEIDCAVVFVDRVSNAVSLETIARVRAANAALPIVVVAESYTPEAGSGALRAGAQEYLTADELGAGLLRAILCAVGRLPIRGPPTRVSRVLGFGDYELDPEIPELRACGEPVKIDRTPLRLLAYLARNAGRTVPKAELLREVWGDVVVSDTAISSALKKLRRVLHDDGAHQRLIETRRGAGYRFTAPLVSAQPPARPAQVRRRQSLAVLPLKNLAVDSDQDYFALGMTEALISALSHLKALRVISRTTVMAYRELERDAPQIARELGVDMLVTGSVAREGPRVRISAQLLDGVSGCLLWAEQYDREAIDLLSLQREVADAILGAIRLELTPEDRARLAPVRAIDPQANDAFLRGQYRYRQYSRDAVEHATRDFLEAIAESPEYAPAYVALAYCYEALCSDFGSLSREHAVRLARGAADRAVELDPRLGEAHAVRGSLLANHAHRWSEADVELRRAVELSPGSPVCLMGRARLTAALGDTDSSLELAYRAVELDPLNLHLRLDFGRLLWCARRYDEAVAEQRRIVALDPELAVAHAELGSSLHHLGRYHEAVAAWRKVMQLLGFDGEHEAEMARAFEERGVVGYWRQWLVSADALGRGHELSPSWMWVPYAALGELDRAFEWLERDFALRGTELAYLKVSPFFDPLRADPRFHALVEKMGLGPAA